jgi:hypothetical protein
MLPTLRSLSNVLSQKRLNECPWHWHLMFINNDADDDRVAFRLRLREPSRLERGSEHEE